MSPRAIFQWVVTVLFFLGIGRVHHLMPDGTYLRMLLSVWRAELEAC